MVSVGWQNDLSDHHGFRQTQTAITSYFLLHNGPLFKYETPVLGPPWSIPFEFPYYQWIVARLAQTTGLSLETAGRLTSEIFFFLTLMVFWGLLSKARVARSHRFLFLALILTSPIYVFWSRTFMIESLALFFGVFYLFSVVCYLKSPRVSNVVLAILMGVVGSTSKVTTFASFFIISGLLLLTNLLKGHHSPAPYRRGLFPLLILIVPLAATVLWTEFTDTVKEMHPIGKHLTSTALSKWNFGTFEQKVNWETWKEFLYRSDLLIGNWWNLGFILLGLALAPKRLAEFLLCAIGFFAPLLIFTNLHYVHDYYAYANGIFLVVIGFWVVEGLLCARGIKGIIGALIFVSIAGFSVRTYRNVYFPSQKRAQNAEVVSIGEAIENKTKPDHAVIVFGLDWTSELHYYSKRRGVAWPTWIPEPEVNQELFWKLINDLGQEKIGALALCGDFKVKPFYLKLADAFQFAPVTKFENSMCSIFLKREEAHQKS